MREQKRTPADVERVVAGVAAVVDTQTGFEYRADSVLNAQMSLRYNIAVAMSDGQAYLEQFTPQRIVEPQVVARSEEHTSELQSLMRISYAVFCLKKNNHTTTNKTY